MIHRSSIRITKDIFPPPPRGYLHKVQIRHAMEYEERTMTLGVPFAGLQMDVKALLDSEDIERISSSRMKVPHASDRLGFLIPYADLGSHTYESRY